MRTRPDALSSTSCQMPVLRSRMPGIQSQPSEAANVGPSSATQPPFSPGPAAMDSSCGMPGCGGGDTRTAITLRLPGRDRPVTSNTPRMNAPRMLPSRLPLIQTSAA